MLTDSQLLTLKSAIAAETDPEFVALRTAGSTGLMAEWFNADSTFVVWKTSVSVQAVGQALNSSEVAGLTTANTSRLQVLQQYSGGSFNPSLADTRSGFDSIFSGASGALTRAALLVLWKRKATRAEKIFATGTGTDGVPGALVFEGRIVEYDVVRALTQV